MDTLLVVIGIAILPIAVGYYAWCGVQLARKTFGREARQRERREESRRKEEEQKARVYRLANENGHLLGELLQLVSSDGGFGNRARIREIGEELNRIGGMDLMQCAYYRVKNAGPYFSQDIWNGIGFWRS